MQLTVLFNGADATDAALLESTRIKREISGRVSTAELTLVTGGIDTEARYDVAHYDVDRYSVDVRELYQCDLLDGNGVLQFSGLVTRVARSWRSPEELEVSVTCSDWTDLLEQAVVPAEAFTAQSDRAMIQAILAKYVPRISASNLNVGSFGTPGYWEIKDKTVRQFLEDLCEWTGAEWYVDFNRNLHYFRSGDYPAPFGLSTAPNGTSTFEYRLDDSTLDFTRRVNRCIVLGGLLPGGSEIRVQCDDPISQARYGVYSYTITDREITLAVDALMRAQAEVEQHAYPDWSGKAVCWRDGLDVGQTLPIRHEALNIDGSYIIRSLEMSWQGSQTETEYSLELGASRPDLERLLRRIASAQRGDTAIPTAVPVAGSVTDASIGSAGLNAGHLVGIISGNNVTVSASTIAGTISGSNVAVDAGTIQGVIQGSNVRVSTGTFEGVIVSSQVADNLIDSLSKLSAQLRPIPDLASDPALNDPNFPIGSFYRNTTTGTFRKNLGTSWTDTTQSDAVTGKLEYHFLGSLSTNKLVGLVAAAQINQVNASSIIGTLTAASVGRIDMSALTGTLNVTNTARIDIGALQGNLDVSRVSNLSSITIGTFAGNLDASRVTNLAAINIGSLTGTLDVSRVTSLNTISIGTFSGSLDASRLTNLTTLNIGSLGGSLDVSRVGNIGTLNINSFGGTINTINAGTLTVTGGGFNDTHIGAVSVGKLLAGTVTATITMTAPRITGGLLAITSTSGNTTNISQNGFSVDNGSQSIGIVGQSISGSSGGGTRWSLSHSGGGGSLQLYNSSGGLYVQVDPFLGVSAGSTFSNWTGYLKVIINGSVREIPYR